MKPHMILLEQLQRSSRFSANVVQEIREHVWRPDGAAGGYLAFMPPGKFWLAVITTLIGSSVM